LKDVPAFSGIKFLKIRGIVAFFVIILTGKNYFKLVKIATGFQSLWERVAEDVRVVLNADIQKIEYNKSEVLITSHEKTETYNSLIVAVPLDKIISKFHKPPFDVSLIEKIKYRPYCCILFKINDANAPVNNVLTMPPRLSADPLIIIAYAAAENVYVAYMANDSHVSEESLRQNLISFIGGFNIKQNAVEFIAYKEWQYYPHVSLEDARNGFYDRINAGQGVNNTYYAGGSVDFESVECCITFSKALIRRYF
jgi:hypothetical protein